jgi:signal transduction histidine kinase
MVSTSIGIATNLAMPLFGNFMLNWLGQVGVVFMIVFISYAILKHHLFDLKIIATEIFVGMLSLVFLVNLVFSVSTSEVVVNSIVLLFSLMFGYLLIRSVQKEVASREQVRKLADNLADTNWELAKKNDELRIIDQRKSEFVSIVSHQLRTPITAIKGYASMLLEGSYGELDQSQRDPVNKIFVSSERLAAMVNDFLDISKIEQGTMQYDIREVDLQKLLWDLLEDFERVAEKRGLTVELKRVGERFVAAVDEGKVRQIISNLLDNAVKYSEHGTIRVTMEESREHHVIRVYIKDQGIGLSQDDLHHLFGKFTRGSEGQKHHTDGSGLGLYIAKKMLEAQRGAIWVDSEGPGKGTTFVVELPVPGAAAPTGPITATPEPDAMTTAVGLS